MPRYNGRRRTAADRCTVTDPDPQTVCNAMTPDGYEYDPLGNRTQASVDSADTFYCAKELNQYETLDDTDDTCPQAGADESFLYDEDGNLIEDGQFVYTWDAENRLIGVAPASSPVNGDKKLKFRYDYMNRRVEKRVYIYDSGWPADNAPDENLRFVYDRWNVVLVLDGLDDNAVLTRYTWGLDLSGQRGNPTASGIHGAGGIGGLLAVEETGGTYAGSYWFLHDANGNVTQLVENTTNYPLAAHYEYDAYGNVLGTPTGYAAANPFRFSTKWFDGESGLGYWGYRFYSPQIGRWLNRDPLEEQAGLHLFAFTENAPQSGIDALGLCKCCSGDCGSEDWTLEEFKVTSYSESGICLPFTRTIAEKKIKNELKKKEKHEKNDCKDQCSCCKCEIDTVSDGGDSGNLTTTTTALVKCKIVISYTWKFKIHIESGQCKGTCGM